MKNLSKIKKIGKHIFAGKSPAGASEFFQKRRIIGQAKRGRSLEHGFLHIPKTGGSSFSEFSRTMSNKGYAMPVKFGHVWTFAKIREKFPDTKISFLIRDPLDRTISSFNSRLRQGRPRFENNWTTEEAVAFSLFHDVQAFLDAMASDTEHSISAVKFCLENIKHLKWNYQNYFRNSKSIERHQDQIYLVGEVDNSIKFWEKLGKECKIPSSLVTENFKTGHISSQTAQSVCANYSEQQISKMKDVLKQEYRIYNSLKKLVNC